MRRRLVGVVLATAILGVIAFVAPSGGATTGETCTHVGGVALFVPPLPKVPSHATVPFVIQTKGVKVYTCTGTGGAAGNVAFTVRAHAKTNCQLLAHANADTRWRGNDQMDQREAVDVSRDAQAAEAVAARRTVDRFGHGRSVQGPAAVGIIGTPNRREDVRLAAALEGNAAVRERHDIRGRHGAANDDYDDLHAPADHHHDDNDDNHDDDARHDVDHGHDDALARTRAPD